MLERPEARMFFLGAMGPNLAQDFRPNVKKGLVKIRIQVGSSKLEIPASAIIGIRRVSKKDWEEAPAEEVYFGKNYCKVPGDITPYRRPDASPSR